MSPCLLCHLSPAIHLRVSVCLLVCTWVWLLLPAPELPRPAHLNVTSSSAFLPAFARLFCRPLWLLRTQAEYLSFVPCALSFLFSRFPILDSFPHFSSLHLGHSHQRCEQRRWRRDTRRGVSRKQAFNKMRHLCFRVFIKRCQLIMADATAASSVHSFVCILWSMPDEHNSVHNNFTFNSYHMKVKCQWWM